MGDLATPLICHAVEWAIERYPPSSPTLCPWGRQESWPRGMRAESFPCPSPTVVLRRVGTAPHLGIRVELDFVVWVRVR